VKQHFDMALVSGPRRELERLFGLRNCSSAARAALQSNAISSAHANSIQAGRRCASGVLDCGVIGRLGATAAEGFLRCIVAQA
jgi:hypothetical protein